MSIRVNLWLNRIRTRCSKSESFDLCREFTNEFRCMFPQMHTDFHRSMQNPCLKAREDFCDQCESHTVQCPFAIPFQESLKLLSRTRESAEAGLEILLREMFPHSVGFFVKPSEMSMGLICVNLRESVAESSSLSLLNFREK